MGKNEIKYPNITVSLVGGSGNTFSILFAMRAAFRKNGIMDKWEEFREEAKSGDYDHLLQTCMSWVNVE